MGPSQVEIGHGLPNDRQDTQIWLARNQLWQQLLNFCVLPIHLHRHTGPERYLATVCHRQVLGTRAT
jgi:hypothetical protein